MAEYSFHFEDFPLYVRLGCVEFERLSGQEVLVSLSGSFQLDHLEDLQSTIDYGALFSALKNTLTGRSYKLIETLCADIAVCCFKEFNIIENLQIKVAKPFIPWQLQRGASVSFQLKTHKEQLSKLVAMLEENSIQRSQL